MRRHGWPGLLFSLALVGSLAASGRARAEDTTLVRFRPGLPASLSLPPLYPSERLRLAWPVVPLRFTFTEVTPIGLGFANGPTSYFVAESLWWEKGPFTLRTRATST